MSRLLTATQVLFSATPRTGGGTGGGITNNRLHLTHTNEYTLVLPILAETGGPIWVTVCAGSRVGAEYRTGPEAVTEHECPEFTLTCFRQSIRASLRESIPGAKTNFLLTVEYPQL
ncbi:hypothetical protein CBL_08644 [Carabus blaptoides fortunei]